MLCLATGTAAWAVYGEIKTIAPEEPLPGTWVVLGYTGPFPLLGPFEANRWRVVMDTLGAPCGTRLQVHWLSPVPDGWAVVRQHRPLDPDGNLMLIENQNEAPGEQGGAGPSLSRATPAGIHAGPARRSPL
jgi:hypothetical protein